MLVPCYLVGFTGHRSGFDRERVEPALTQVLSGLKQSASAVHGTVHLYTSVAEGCDTLCVRLARHQEIPVHLLLPLEESDFARDFSPGAWELAATELARARERPGQDSIHLVAGEATRPECYFNQGVEMLRAVDLLVAVTDGTGDRGLGGTGSVIALARTMGLPVVMIDAATGTVTASRPVAEAFHADPILTELNGLTPPGPAGSAAPANPPEALQQDLDRVAIAEAERYRPTLVHLIVLHGLATMVAAIVNQRVPDHAHWFPQNHWMLTATELVLVVVAMLLSARHSRRHTQQRWVRCRFACELVRGLRASVPLIDPLHPPITHHQPAWKRFALSAGLLVQQHQPTHDPAVLRDTYLATRLSETHPESQLLHYRIKKPTETWWWNLIGLVAVWSARLAPVFVLLSLLNTLSDRWHPGQGWQIDFTFLGWVTVALLPIALPLLAGTANGLRAVLDVGRRKDRYPEMVARLEEARHTLPALQTPSTIRSTVIRTEDILLDELVEWQHTV